LVFRSGPNPPTSWWRFRKSGIAAIDGTGSLFIRSSSEKIASIADQVCKTIKRRVCKELREAEAQPEIAFAGLADAIRKHGQAPIRFFSLNHDLLLDEFLNGKFDHYDCFEPHPETKAYRRLSFSRERLQAAPVSLVKLHGSINCLRIGPKWSKQEENPWKGEFIGIKSGDNSNFEVKDDPVQILIGTFNKMLQYSRAVFLRLFAEFQYSLRNA
jgi:hypothetical protein